MSNRMITPSFQPPQTATNAGSPEHEPASIRGTISALNLRPHIEGGYFAETDRDAFLIPNPFLDGHDGSQRSSVTKTASASAAESPTRNASTTIHYLLTPRTPQGGWHRNKGRTIHTLHWGRGRYVIIHADEVVDPEDYGAVREGMRGKARVETFVVGRDVGKGEKVQWIVEGGKFKASFLLPDDGDSDGHGEKKSEGLLISETVIPGFEYSDHDFMTRDMLDALVTPEKAQELAWLLRKGEAPKPEEL